MTVETFFATFGHLADAPNGVQKLREMILQLAVQGKLVPQDPKDEPAAVLLERIKAGKERLARPGATGKITSVKLVDPEEQLFNVPENWIWSRLDEICSYIQRGKGPVYVEKSDFPVVSQKCVQWSGFTLAPARFVCPSTLEKYADERFLRTGDLLWNSTGTGTIGRINVYKHEENPYDKVVADSHVTVVRPVYVNSKYVWIWLASPYIQTDLEENASGSTNQVELATSAVKEQTIPIPPLEEQTRIVAKVDQLMALCDELEARRQKQQQARVRLNNAALEALLTAREPDEFADHWQRICTSFDLLYDHPETIAKLRAAILQLAVQGKLISQENPNLWHAGVLGDVVEKSEAGWSPQCENRPATDGEWGVLKVSAVSWGQFDPNENKALPSHLEPRARWAVNKDDFLISRANTAELVAKSVVVDQSYPRLLMSDKIIRINFRGDSEPRFFNLVNNSPFAREYYSRVAGGTSSSMKNVSRQQILALPVMIPPLEEQKRIVVKVDQLMSLCDALEAKLNQARQHSEKLMEATVRQFLGTAAPQRPHTARPPAKGAAPAPTRKARAVYPVAEATDISIPAEIPATCNNSNIPERILRQMKGDAEYSRADLLVATGIREGDWIWAIRQLKEQGKVVQTGERRGARYRVSK